jgi:U3 small nucleolar RNA-associated protein 14
MTTKTKALKKKQENPPAQEEPKNATLEWEPFIAAHQAEIEELNKRKSGCPIVLRCWSKASNKRMSIEVNTVQEALDQLVKHEGSFFNWSIHRVSERGVYL